MRIHLNRPTGGRRSLSSAHLVPLVVILGAVVVANGPAVLHLVTSNPLVLDAALTPAVHGSIPGLPYIDGNAGFTTQALGHLAVSDWLHGHVPWWNPYEGVGSPLAGEMQSGAFFPLTALLAFRPGVLLEQLCLEAIAGWSTYFLMRRLDVGRTFSTAAGVAFGLCGTFAWLAHAPIRPAALLPLTLIGVERAIGAAREGRRGGWRLLALALALSILAGFPETTLIDAIFAIGWAALRLAGPGRPVWRACLSKLALGVAVGSALAAPLIVAFADYLPYGYTGGHTGAVAHASLPTVGLSQLVLPYSLGPIFGFRSAAGLPDTISGTWAYVGGFLMVTVIAAGLVGLFGSRLRPLRIGLAAWIGLCLLRTFGFSPLVHLVSIVPGLRLTAFYRYADPSWELAAVVLAALGLDDLARGHRARAKVIGAAAVAGGLAVWAAIAALGVMGRAVPTSGHAGGHPRSYPTVSLIGALALLVVLVVGGFLAGGPVGRSAPEGDDRDRATARRRRGRVVMAGAVGLEAVLLLGFTYLSALPPTALETGSVQWLQAHLSSYRFVTLGPIQPNYGSYYGIAEANINDLPVPKAWNRYIEGHLDPNALPAVFSGGGRINPAGPTPAQELAAHLPAYEAAGVRYVVEAADGRDVQGQPFPAAAPTGSPPGPRLVYRDHFAEIWQLPSPAPSFSLAPVSSGRTGSTPVHAQGCGVTWSGWDDAFVHCAQPTVLTRRVLSMPGWTASANGRRLPVSVDTGEPAGLFQQTLVPAGVTHVRFRFVPPHEGWALALAALAGLTVVLSFLWDGSPRRKRFGTDGEVAPGHAVPRRFPTRGRAVGPVPGTRPRTRESAGNPDRLPGANTLGGRDLEQEGTGV